MAHTAQDNKDLLHKRTVLTNQEVADWLRSCRGTEDIKSVLVSIDKETFAGASYRQNGLDRLYLLGEIPRPHLKCACVFTIEGREWYIAGGYTPTMCKPFRVKCEANTHHPFGANFMLMLWDTKMPIEDPWSKPYIRIPMRVHKT